MMEPRTRDDMKCSCCGSPLVRVWLFEKCGPCLRESGEWSEERHEEELKACARQMDPRLRSLPFFVPVPLRKRPKEDLLS